MTDMHVINLLAEVEPWFTNPGLAGGLIGGGVGVLGATYGSAVGVLAPRGKGRAFVMALHWAALMGTMTPIIKLRYRQAEHRRLTAEEFRRG